MPFKKRSNYSWTEFDDEEQFDKPDVQITWVDFLLNTIIAGGVIFLLFMMCKFASNASRPVTIPVAGINRHLMQVQTVAEVRADRMRKEEEEKQKAEQNLKMAYEGYVIQAFGYYASPDEVMLLKRVCMAEGGNTETVKGLVAIFSVARNRIFDPRFPDTVSGVCLQSGQFETVSTGRIWNYEVNDKVEEAWELFLQGGYEEFPDICFFTAGGYNPYCRPAFKLGGHYFGY